MKMRLFFIGLIGIAGLSIQGISAEVEEPGQEKFDDWQNEPTVLSPVSQPYSWVLGAHRAISDAYANAASRMKRLRMSQEEKEVLDRTGVPLSVWLTKPEGQEVLANKDIDRERAKRIERIQQLNVLDESREKIMHSLHDIVKGMDYERGMEYWGPAARRTGALLSGIEDIEKLRDQEDISWPGDELEKAKSILNDIDRQKGENDEIYKAYDEALRYVKQYVDRIESVLWIRRACMVMPDNDLDLSNALINHINIITCKAEGLKAELTLYKERQYEQWRALLQDLHLCAAQKDSFINMQLNKEALGQLAVEARTKLYARRAPMSMHVNMHGDKYILDQVADDVYRTIIGMVFPAYEKALSKVLSIIGPAGYDAWFQKPLGNDVWWQKSHEERLQALERILDDINTLCVAYPFAVSKAVIKDIFVLGDQVRLYRHMMDPKITMSRMCKPPSEQEQLFDAFELKNRVGDILRNIRGALKDKAEELYGIDLGTILK